MWIKVFQYIHFKCNSVLLLLHVSHKNLCTCVWTVHIITCTRSHVNYTCIVSCIWKYICTMYRDLCTFSSRSHVYTMYEIRSVSRRDLWWLMTCILVEICCVSRRDLCVLDIMMHEVSTRLLQCISTRFMMPYGHYISSRFWRQVSTRFCVGLRIFSGGLDFFRFLC